MNSASKQFSALSGIIVVEVAGGVAGAYCAKLFADMGATVLRIVPAEGDPMESELIHPDERSTRGLYAAYLNAGKQVVPPNAVDQVDIALYNARTADSASDWARAGTLRQPASGAGPTRMLSVPWGKSMDCSRGG